MRILGSCHSERGSGHKRGPVLPALVGSELRKGLFLFCAVIVLLVCTSASSQTAPRAAQPSSGLTVRDVTFHSTSLARDMTYRIVLPAGYETSGRRYPVLYILHGLMGHYSDWESRTHLDDYVADLPLIIAMPEGDDSWYTNSASQPQEKWEDYIAKDFVNEIDAKYRTIATRHARAIAGLSMGGYGALKFALKYPSAFVFAASFSGAEVVVHDPSYKITFGKKYVDQIHDIFGEGMTQTRSDNDIFELASKHHVDLYASVVVGDALSDLHAGRVAGCDTLLVLTGRGRDQLVQGFTKHWANLQVASDLSDAADLILMRGQAQPDLNPRASRIDLAAHLNSVAN